MENLPDKIRFYSHHRDAIEQLTEEQLYWLNEIIVDRIRYLQKLHELQAVSKFRRGQKVTWRHQGHIYTGSVIKVNQKTITAHEADPPYRKWKLSPEFVSVM